MLRDPVPPCETRLMIRTSKTYFISHGDTEPRSLGNVEIKNITQSDKGYTIKMIRGPRFYESARIPVNLWINFLLPSCPRVVPHYGSARSTSTTYFLTRSTKAWDILIPVPAFLLSLFLQRSVFNDPIHHSSAFLSDLCVRHYHPFNARSSTFCKLLIYKKCTLNNDK